jgi:RimK-like ATP-grasp domain
MILMVSVQTDLHARLVQRRLREKGVESVIFDMAEVPAHTRLSARVAPGAAPRMQIRREREPKVIDLSKVDSVWFRRWDSLTLDPNMSPEDHEFAKLESFAMLQSLVVLLEDRFFINHPVTAHATDAGNGKIGHLEHARKAGLVVPRTLATNDPDEARAFIEECPAGAIYKPFRTAVRMHTDEAGEEQASLIFTTKMDDATLARLDGVVHAPCIFQEMIPKKFELRVIVMGERVFACELHSQVREEFAVDFRRDSDMSETPHVPHDLPREIGQKLIAVNKALGLVYGAFDLILTPDGRYVFLEVNQGGQFLWLEEQGGLPLLENFTEMLIQRRLDFVCDAPLHEPRPFRALEPLDA